MSIRGAYHQVHLGQEQSTTPVAGANDTVVGTANTYFSVLGTMPTSAALYIATGLEILNGTVVNGNVQLSLWNVSQDPATTNNISTFAFTPIVAQSGASAIQRVSLDGGLQSRLIPAGAIVAGSICSSSATARYGTTTVAAENNLKAITIAATPPNATNVAWASGTEEIYFKLYYKAVL